jgi:hypothetical protein
VAEDLEWDPGSLLDGCHDPRSVRRPAQWLRADERGRRGAQVGGGRRVSTKRVSELVARLRTERTPGIDRGPETQEDRFVDQWTESMPGDDGDEDMDRVRSEVDGGADGRSRGHALSR